MPPKKKSRGASGVAEHTLLPFVENTPLKTNAAALEVFSATLVQLAQKLEPIIMTDILLESDQELLQGSINHVFKDLTDDMLTPELRTKWHSALACEKFLEPEQLTVAMIRDHLLASAFECVIYELCQGDIQKLASALNATPVPPSGGPSSGEVIDPDPVVEGILDALVPPDEFLKTTRDQLLESATSEELAKDLADDASASALGRKVKWAPEPAPAAAASTTAPTRSKLKRPREADSDDDEKSDKSDGKSSSSGSSSEASSDEKEDDEAADPFLTETKQQLMKRGLDALKSYVTTKWKDVDVGKRPTKARLVEIIIENRK